MVRLSLWNHPGDGIYGMFARCERMVRSCEKILGGEVYHYHSKMIMKDAKVGGAWAWHQDYGYWYQNGVLFPDLVERLHRGRSRARKENGCLQVIRGSHHCGRIDHVLTGDQAGADRERVEEILKRPNLPARLRRDGPGRRPLLPPATCCTARDQNTSRQPALGDDLLLQRGAQRPVQGSHHPRYTPLNVVPDAAIKRGRREAVRGVRRRGVARRCSRFEREEPASKRHKTGLKNNSGHFCLVLPVPAF